MHDTTLSRWSIWLLFACAFGLGVACTLVFDCASPNIHQVQAVSSISTLPSAHDLAMHMHTQIYAGAPGVALALEQNAPPEVRRRIDVMAARAYAFFELGNAPQALEIIQAAQRLCATTYSCTYGERSMLERLAVFIDAVVSTGVVDTKQDPARTQEALRTIMSKVFMMHTNL